MLVRKEGVEVHALRRRGWSISAIARRLGRDRKTARGYLSGNRILGERTPAELDPFDPSVRGLCASAVPAEAQVIGVVAPKSISSVTRRGYGKYI